MDNIIEAPMISAIKMRSVMCRASFFQLANLSYWHVQSSVNYQAGNLCRSRGLCNVTVTIGGTSHVYFTHYFSVSSSIMRQAAITSLILVLVGCAPAHTRLMIHKTGSRQADRVMAHDNCKIASFKEIPQTQGIATQGGYSNPGTVRCTTNFGVTNCNTVGAVNIPTTTSSYNVNQDLRTRFITRCLAEKGFSVVPLKKTCRSADERAAVARDLVSQRPFNQITCYDSTIPPL